MSNDKVVQAVVELEAARARGGIYGCLVLVGILLGIYGCDCIHNAVERPARERERAADDARRAAADAEWERTYRSDHAAWDTRWDTEGMAVAKAVKFAEDGLRSYGYFSDQWSLEAVRASATRQSDGSWLVRGPIAVMDRSDWQWRSGTWECRLRLRIGHGDWQCLSWQVR